MEWRNPLYFFVRYLHFQKNENKQKERLNLKKNLEHNSFMTLVIKL